MTKNLKLFISVSSSVLLPIAFSSYFINFNNINKLNKNNQTQTLYTKNFKSKAVNKQDLTLSNINTECVNQRIIVTGELSQIHLENLKAKINYVMGNNNTINIPEIISIQHWINNNLKSIFRNLVSEQTIAKISYLSSNEISSEQNIFIVPITLNEAFVNGQIKNDVIFEITLTGFNTNPIPDTICTFPQNINYQESFLKQLLPNNKLFFAIDWACLSMTEFETKVKEMNTYIESNWRLFLQNYFDFEDIVPFYLSSYYANWDNINNNVLSIASRIQGYVNNKLDYQTKFINFNWRAIDETEMANDIFSNIFDALSLIINNSDILPTADKIKTTICNTINQNPQLLINIPLAYLNNKNQLDISLIDIDLTKITEQENKVIINSGLLILKPNHTKLTNLNKAYTNPIKNIVLNNKQYIINKAKIIIANNNYWLWIVIASGILLFITLIILLIALILRNKRKKEQYKFNIY